MLNPALPQPAAGPDPETRDTVTGLVTDGEGDPRAALDRLHEYLYADLRVLARAQLGGAAHGQTLSVTALVHEAYLRLAGDARVTERGRAYFLGAAARAMRRVVVEYARSRRRQKRGGGAFHLSLDESLVAGTVNQVDVLDLENGLNELANLTERPVRVVECRFFAGLTVEETALALGVTDRTVKRDWAFARAWLFDYLRHREDGTNP